jgi:hemolysin activation/secretion protein
MFESMNAQLTLALLATSALAMASPSLAQTVGGQLPPPTAGDILQQSQQTLPQPPPRSDLDLGAPAASPPAVPGGAAVAVTDVEIVGATRFDTRTLKAQLGAFAGHSFDLAGMRTLADKIAGFYRAHGYPFTRAVLPVQDLKNGALRIQVLEGHYGKVSAGRDADLAEGAQPFLNTLKPGDLIQANRLERAMLLLNDQPGMKAYPVISPGHATGGGDLVANVRRVARFGGDVGADNQGSRYVGEYRGRVDLYAYSPFRFGDMIDVHGLYSNLGMWLGSAGYETPLGGSGPRAKVGYDQTDYALGAPFKDLDATGFAKVVRAKLSYPSIRSRDRNLTLSVEGDFKSLEDRYGAIHTVNPKSSVTWPVMAQFDERDALGAGGLTYGVLGVTPGHLNLGEGLALADVLSARSNGSFVKATLDVTRIQSLNAHASLSARVAGQWAGKNLDASEKFVPGGPPGVRAFPVGEALGDEGVLAQLEARYSLGPATPYAFFDAAYAQTSHQPWDQTSAENRSLSGAGFGLRTGRRGWTIDAAVAWQISSGPSVSEGKNVNPHVWVTTSYPF